MATTVYMMIGLPYSGKTYYTNKNLPNVERVSSDDIVLRKTKEIGKTYSSGFNDVIKSATSEFNSKLEKILRSGKDFVFDRTNLTINTRKKFIKKFLDHGYKVVGIYFDPISDEEYKARKKQRTQQVILDKLYYQMKKSYQKPTYEEGFAKLIKGN